MPKNRIIISIGVVIALLPLLGFPHSWESTFQILAGLSIITLSVWSNIDKKLTLKAKAQMRQHRKVVSSVPPVSAVSDTVDEEVDQAFGKRVTDFYPKTGQPGRRVTDLKPNILGEDVIEERQN